MSRRVEANLPNWAKYAIGVGLILVFAGVGVWKGQEAFYFINHGVIAQANVTNKIVSGPRDRRRVDLVLSFEVDTTTYVVRERIPVSIMSFGSS